MARTKKRITKKRKSRRCRKRKQKGGANSKAYVINLDKRTDRWNQIQEKFKGSSVELERVSAVENDDKYLACSLSHLKVVQMAKDKNLPTVLIFEDDNKPTENFDKRWQIVKKWLDNNTDKWEIFNGGGAWHEYEHEGHEKEFDIKLKYKMEENINLFNCAKVLRTNFIYINSSAYDKVLKWSRDLPDKDVTYCIDTYIGSRKYFNTLCIYPFLGTQENGVSDLMKIDKNTTEEDKRRNNFMNGILERQLIKNKKIVFERNPHGGFFSNFNMLIDNLANSNNIVEIEYNVLSGGESLLFVKEGEELFSKLFENYKEKDKTPEYTEYINTYKTDNIKGKDASNMYGENRNKLQPYNDAFKKYIFIKQNIKDKINEEIKKLKEGKYDKLIGLLVRSKDLGGEQPRGYMPSREEYMNELNKLGNNNKYFLRIDNNDDLKYYKEKLQQYYATNINRSNSNQGNAPHRNNLQSVNDLENIYIEIYLLSECNVLVHCVSNMATASLYMNMDQQSVFIK
jgi:GR25 family glycosyltransferase involved in LPS biosynthesis